MKDWTKKKGHDGKRAMPAGGPWDLRWWQSMDFVTVSLVNVVAVSVLMLIFLSVVLARTVKNEGLKWMEGETATTCFLQSLFPPPTHWSTHTHWMLKLETRGQTYLCVSGLNFAALFFHCVVETLWMCDFVPAEGSPVSVPRCSIGSCTQAAAGGHTDAPDHHVYVGTLTLQQIKKKE